jgi:hypothetical protein
VEKEARAVKIVDTITPTHSDTRAKDVWFGQPFEYEGHRYMRIRPDSLHTQLVVEDDRGRAITYSGARLEATPGMVVAANLKSGTIRGLDSGALVRLLDIEVVVKGYLVRAPEEGP